MAKAIEHKGMKILIVSWSITPYSTSGSSEIIENLTKQFQGNEVVVLGGRGPFSKNKATRKNEVLFYSFPSELSFFGRGRRFFEWYANITFSILVKRIVSVIKEEKIDYVLGVYPNQHYCLAAKRAAIKTNTKFSSYFHNTYVENAAISDSNAVRIQKEIFDASHTVFVMSKGMQKVYQDQYKLDKVVPLVHTFNQYPEADSYTGILKNKKEKYRLVAFGNFNESNIDATKRFLNAIKHSTKYELSIYTHVPKILLQKRGLDTSLFHYMGSVASEEIHSALQNFDICILTHGFSGGYGEIEYKTIFPTRTIPMLLSGKPLFAHSPPGSFLNEFLKEYGCAELVEQPSEKEIIEGLDKICDSNSYQKELVANAKEASSHFYGPDVVVKLKKELLSH